MCIRDSFKELVEKWATSNDLIYLVMPQNAEFIAQQNKDKKVYMEEESDGEKENIRQLHLSTTTPAGESNKSTNTKKKLKKFHHSTDISSNEGDRPEEIKKPKKKRFSKHNITSGNSSEEEENVNQKSQARNISKRITKRDSISETPARKISEAVIQQTEGGIPVGWQNEG